MLGCTTFILEKDKTKQCNIFLNWEELLTPSKAERPSRKTWTNYGLNNHNVKFNQFSTWDGAILDVQTDWGKSIWRAARQKGTWGSWWMVSAM